jgi:C1A family cysteine protease
MSDPNPKHGMGWLPDYPDIRDYDVDATQVSSRLKALGRKESIKDMLKRIGIPKLQSAKLDPQVDLRDYCTPIEDQENLGSCTAQAGVGLVEYFEKRAFGRHLDAARLFLYKVTRNLLGFTGDTGAFLRTTMAAMALFGVPPEEYWEYETEKFDVEPSAFCYAFGQSYQALQYYRLDPPSTPKDELLARIKTGIAAKLPSMFGFVVYESYRQAEATGEIPYPTLTERVLGGHAVDAVGYDDAKEITNTNPGGTTTKGALLIRNSWGVGWGDEGYGWLPYEYVLKGLAEDWWSLLKNEWIDTDQFGLDKN